MKLYWKSLKYKRYNKKRQLKSSKAKKKRKKIIKKHNKIEMLPIKLRQKKKFENKYTQILKAPNELLLFEYPDKVLKFFSQIQYNINHRISTLFNLKDITAIDYPSETILVGLLNQFKNKKISFDGYLPKDKKIQTKLLSSDFFKHLSLSKKRNSIYYTIGKPNQIFAEAEKKVVPELAAQIIEECSQALEIEKKKLKGLYTILIELMQNTHNHASKNKRKEMWWLSKNQVDKVYLFSFLDLGIGIIESVKKKAKIKKLDYFINLIKSEKIKTQDILKNLLLGKLSDITKDPYFRGKGLPALKEYLEKGRIDNLHILTNNIFYNVKKDKFIKINFEFKGTFFYFETKK